MAPTRSISCSGPDCAPPATGWRRLVRWPLFLALAALHLAVLPLLLSEPGDRILTLLAGAFYLLLATLTWSRGPRATA